MTDSASPTLSPSVEQALRWAEACAALIPSNSSVTENELFLGLLLTHPDTLGEMRVVLEHFGLTARDVLPDNYPTVSAESLARAAATVSGTRPEDWSADVTDIISTATSIGGGTAQVVHVMSALLSRPTGWQGRLQIALSRFGVPVTVLASELGTLLLPSDEDAKTGHIDLQAEDTAGAQIRQWLRQRFPRRPAAVAGFISDVPNPASDFVSVGIEADAFAYLVASKALAPPLAIGLFGNWGSGKSFLMAKIKQRVRQLTKLAADNPGPDLHVWRNIAPIEFNAWQYVETDLWAALLHHIFACLTPETQEKLAELSESRQQAKAELAQQETEVAHAQDELDNKVAVEDQRNLELVAAAKRLDLVRVEAAAVRETMVARSLEGSARKVLRGRVIDAAVKALGKDDAQAIVDAERTARQTSRSLLRRRYWTWKRVVYVLAALVLVPLAAWAANVFIAAKLAALGATLSALLVVVLPAARTVLTDLREAQQAAEEAVDKQLTAVLVAAETERKKAAEELDHARADTAQARESAVNQETRRSELEHEVRRLTPGSLYREFLAGRGSSQDYRKRLSLVTTIHDDLEKLAQLTRLYNTAQNSAPVGDPSDHDPHAPPNRIILYIDDLDRCPPKRVVEVLEAVHLLLAFELFVVIVAVDTRWLVSALPRALLDLTSDPNGGGTAPSPMDYIEKIFQIPFWVEPLDDPARQRLLRGLFLPALAPPEAGAAEPAEAALHVTGRETELVREMLTDYGSWLDVDARRLSITPEELAFLESLAPLMASTPRQVKRFVNTCQFLLAMAPPLDGNGDPPTERMAACFMAAVHETMPQLAERVAGAASPLGQPPATWRSVLDSLGPDDLRVERERLSRWFVTRNAERAKTGLAPFELTPVQTFTKRWDVITRIRFMPKGASTSSSAGLSSVGSNKATVESNT